VVRVLLTASMLLFEEKAIANMIGSSINKI